jgi:16S rRNA U516 pseudouridylate synthase RsuA-like enzyme
MMPLQVRKRKVKTPEPTPLDVNPLGAACERMRVDQMIRGATEACEKLAEEKARQQEADTEARRQEYAEKYRIAMLMKDVAVACDSLNKAKSRPVDDLIQNVFHSVMTSPM